MGANVTVSALRDMGCVRTNNEDNYAYDPTLDLYIVCDGMGGMAAGEVASSIACSVALQTFAAQAPETPALAKLAAAIHAANDAVRQSSAQNAEQHGMGTTLVAAVVEGSKVIIGNVGDSRAYLLQDSRCVQLTVDHSYINELVRNGTVKVEDIHSVNLKGLESVITRAIGAAPAVDPDFFAVDLKENDTLLLASDGLTRYVNSGGINSMIDPQDLDQSCHRLIEAAKAAGGADNITCLLLRYNFVAAGEEAAAIQSIQTTVEAPVEAVPVEEAPLVEAVAAEEIAEPVEIEPVEDEPIESAPVAATPVLGESFLESDETLSPPHVDEAPEPVEEAAPVAVEESESPHAVDQPATIAAEPEAEPIAAELEAEPIAAASAAEPVEEPVEAVAEAEPAAAEPVHDVPDEVPAPPPLASFEHILHAPAGDVDIDSLFDSEPAPEPAIAAEHINEPKP